MWKWILLFLAVPVAEVVIYVIMGEHIGLIPTLAIIFGSGVAGAILAKQQGFALIGRVRHEVRSGQVPGHELLDGFLILIGAILLLTPGLLTDITGFILLIPYTRRFFHRFLKRKLQDWILRGKSDIFFYFNK